MVYIFFINFFYQDREDEKIRDVMKENYPADEVNGKF